MGHIDYLVSSNLAKFYFTGFYGNSNPKYRVHSWSLLDKIAHTHTDKNIGWLTGCDFNEILYDEDKRGGVPRSLNQIIVFRNALIANSLVSLNENGPKYIWDNKCKGPYHILKCLDRFVTNEACISSFPNHHSTNLDFFNSDHRPVILNSNPHEGLGRINI